MLAHNVIANGYTGDAKSTIQIAKRAAPVQAPTIINTIHTREVHSHIDNSRLDMLEKMNNNIQQLVASKDSEIQALRQQVDNILHTNNSHISTLNEKVSSLEQSGLMNKVKVDNLSSTTATLQQVQSILQQIQTFYRVVHQAIGDIDMLRNIFSTHQQDTTAKLDSVDNRLQGHSSLISSLHQQLDKHNSHLIGVSSHIPVHQDQLQSILSQMESLKSKVDSNKTYLEGLVNTLNDLLNRKEGEIYNLHVQLQQLSAKVGSHGNDISSVMSQIEEKQQELHRLRQEVSSTLTNIPSMTIGDQTNIPQQPEPHKVNGVWSTAPTSLVVNGGVVLHDIGYSNSKNLMNVGWDPSTSRLIIKTK